MSDEPAGEKTYVSPSSLGSYAYCPRKYDFEKAQRIETIDDTKRYLQQGRAMHTTIERTTEATTRETPATAIYETMAEEFPTAWDEEVDSDEFASTADYEYARRTARAGLDAFFAPDDGPGIDHARQSVAVERKLQCERNGVPLNGYADNILATDDGLHVIDYKRSLSGMLTTGTAERLAAHLAGTEHEPKRVKNAMQVATYIEGVKDTELYDPEMQVRFTFYGLLNHTDVEADPDGYTVQARGYGREMTGIYDEQYETIWDLITKAYEGIEAQAYDPDPWTLIYEEACDDCAYRSMCPDYLGQEVHL